MLLGVWESFVAIRNRLGIVERHTLHEYFWFGTCVRYLQSVNAGEPIHEPPESSGAGFVLFNLDQLFSHLADLNLKVTTRAAWRLRPLRDELAASEQLAKLTLDQANRLRLLIKELRLTIEAELQGLDAFVPTPKRLDVRALMDDVSQLFAPGIFAKLPVVARVDLSEAGRCLAMERPTAAAFHMLRGTEAVLRAFYHTLAKRKRNATMWGPIVADLRRRRSANEQSIVLNHLDHIRVAFRNPTAHPEKFYDIQEAQDLWSICADAINRMALVLP